MESQRLQGCNPRLYRLKTDGLAPVSKYWTYRSHASDMSPISLVSPACDRYVNRGCLYPHCFNGWLRRETGYGPMDRSAIVLWIVLGALFLRSSDSVHHCWWLRERLLCVDRVRYVWCMTIRGLSMGCVWCVGRVFPCRVYIDSNHRDSRIWVPLVRVSLHIANQWHNVY
jgi:hypothetical protein